MSIAFERHVPTASLLQSICELVCSVKFYVPNNSNFHNFIKLFSVFANILFDFCWHSHSKYKVNNDFRKLSNFNLVSRMKLFVIALVLVGVCTAKSFCKPKSEAKSDAETIVTAVVLNIPLIFGYAIKNL